MMNIALSALTFICLALMMSWLSFALARSGYAGDKRQFVKTVTAAIIAWLVFTACLAKAGFLAKWDAIPPRVPMIPLVSFICLMLVARTAQLKKLIQATPRYLPVAMQSFRIFVELSFYGLFLAGGAPILVTFDGRNFDMLVGLTAPIVALAILKLNLNPRAVIVWNILGVLILLNTIFTTLTALPGLLHLNWPGEPFTAFGHWPFVWIPTFLAPLALFLHVFSIRQNIAVLKAKI